MATPTFVSTPSQETQLKTAALAITTSSAEIVIGINKVFEINSDQDITIAWGTSGMGAATAANFRIPANTMMRYDMGSAFSSIRVFNLSGTTTANIYIQPVSKLGS